MNEIKILIEPLLADDAQRVINNLFKDAGLKIISTNKKKGEHANDAYEMTVQYTDASLLVMLGRVLQNLHDNFLDNNDTIMTSYND